jgi:hypothetical protein
MRPHTLASVFLALLVAGISLSVPTVPNTVMASQESPAHPLIGSWRLSTTGASSGEPVRTGIFTFREDGSIFVVFQSRPNGIGTAEPIWWGEGRWEAEGTAAARYTMSWKTRDDPNAPNGTVTFDGALMIHSDGITFEDDRQQSMVTVRNANGILIATYGAGADELTARVTGRRIEVGSP